jgi:asparagine synthetase B (glutamine-hydrolysing)
MCGIAGFFSQQERGPETTAAMMDALQNRTMAHGLELRVLVVVVMILVSSYCRS